MRRKIFAGYVGPGAADEFEAFWRVYSDMISFDEILSDPEHAKLPSDARPDLQCAVSGMLGNLMNHKNANKVFAYVARMPKEHQIITATAAVKRDPGVKNTKGYATWFVDNQDVLI